MPRSFRAFCLGLCKYRLRVWKRETGSRSAVPFLTGDGLKRMDMHKAKNTELDMKIGKEGWQTYAKTLPVLLEERFAFIICCCTAQIFYHDCQLQRPRCVCTSGVFCF